VRWLAEAGPGLGIDPERIAIGGDSAGANLAVACCIVLRDAGEPARVKAMLLNYGGFDVVNSEDSARRYGGAGFMLGFDEMQAFWQNYMREPEDADNPLVCPLRANLAGLPPAFLTIPECDLLAEQSHAMAGRMNAAGVALRAEVYVGASHSFLEAVSVSEVADRALTDGAQWLAGNLRPR
jgi:acetyl esterase/lipase